MLISPMLAIENYFTGKNKKKKKDLGNHSFHMFNYGLFNWHTKSKGLWSRKFIAPNFLLSWKNQITQLNFIFFYFCYECYVLSYLKNAKIKKIHLMSKLILYLLYKFLNFVKFNLLFIFWSKLFLFKFLLFYFICFF